MKKITQDILHSPFWQLTSFSLVVIFLSILSYRWVFFYRFDFSYMTDWYEHSQWTIPLSSRVMGDAELYQVSGFHLAHGEDPFQLNPEVPPAGKYLFGWSIMLFNNPYIASIVIYLLSILCFATVAQLILREKNLSAFAVALFTLSPLFFSQIGQVGLDVLQLVFLLLHLAFLFLLFKKPAQKNRIIFVIFLTLSCVSLGLFTATKIGVFTPLIFLVDSWYLWRKKYLFLLAGILSFSIASYMGTYAAYFFAHHSLIDWLRAQKWIIHFYISSHIRFIPFMIMASLFGGVFVNWWDGMSVVKEWTLLWPLSLYVFARTVWQKKFWWSAEISTEKKYVALLVAALVLMNCVIPFWPRYLIVVFPFLLLMIVQFSAGKKILQLSLLAMSCVFFLFYIFPQPNEMLMYAKTNLQQKTYAEAYNFLDEKTQAQTPRQMFIAQIQRAENQLQVSEKKVTIGHPFVWPWQTEVRTSIQTEYQTPLGALRTSQPLILRKEHNQWRIVWDWQIVAPHFSPDSQIALIIEPVHLAALKSSDSIVLSTQGPMPFISVIPGKIQDLEKTIALISQVTALQPPDLRNEIVVVAAQGLQLPISFVRPDYDPKILDALQKLPGVFIDQKPTRAYFASVAMSPYISKIRHIEEAHPELNGQTGGSVVITTPSGEQTTIFHVDPKPGSDFMLPDDFQTIFGKGV
jgi:hypothetical protein